MFHPDIGNIRANSGAAFPERFEFAVPTFFLWRAFYILARRTMKRTKAGSVGPAGIRKDIGQRWRERPSARDSRGRELQERAAKGSVGRNGQHLAPAGIARHADGKQSNPAGIRMASDIQHVLHQPI